MNKTTQSNSPTPPSEKISRKRLLFYAVFSAIFLCILVAAFPSKEALMFEKSGQAAALNFDHAESAALNESEINDFTPMFLPTKWNYSFQISAITNLQEQDLFAKKDSNTELQIRPSEDFLDNKIKHDDSFDDMVLRVDTRSRFSGFSIEENAFANLAKDAGKKVWAEIIDINSSQRIKSIALDYNIIADKEAWSPIEIIMQIDLPGAIPQTMIMSHSGSEKVDSQFLKLISQDKRFRNFACGYYKININP